MTRPSSNAPDRATGGGARLAAAVRAVAGIWLGAVGSAAAAFVTQLLIARLYGVAAVGTLVSAVSIATIAAPIALFGTHWFANDARVIAEPARWQRAMRRIFLAATATAAVGAFGAARWIGLDGSAAAMAGAIVLSVAAVEKAVAHFQVARRFTAVALVQPVSYLTRLAAVAVAAIASTGLAFAWQLTALLQVVATLVLASTTGFLRVTRVAGGARAIGVAACARELVPLLGIGLVAVAYMLVDRLLVARMLGTEAAGLYGTAASLLLFAEILPAAAASRYLLPLLGHAGVAGGARPMSPMRVVLVAGAAGTAFALAYRLVADWLVVLLFGAPFAPGAALMNTLAAYLPARFVVIALGPFFLREGRKGLKLAVDTLALGGLCAGLVWTLSDGTLDRATLVKPIAETALAVVLTLLILRDDRRRSARAG